MDLSKLNADITKVVNEDTAEILIYGSIGNKIDGDLIARDIKMLEDMGIKTIVERINSDGGYVTNGLSVVTANLRSKAEIHTYNDGIAASMAGIILLTGNKIFAADYSQIMLHEPRIGNETIDKTKDEKIKNALMAIRDSLSKIIQNRTGKGKDDVDEILKDETWYSAKQAKKAGLIDEIVTYAKKPKIKSNMEPSDIISAVAAMYNDNSHITNIKEIKMSELKLIASNLELDENANVNQINKAVNKLQKENGNIVDENTTLKADNETLKADVTEKDGIITTQKEAIDKFEDEKKALNKTMVEQDVDSAIEKGLFKKDERENLVNTFIDNHAGLKTVIGSLNERAADISNKINTEASSELIPENRKDWDYRKWEKEDAKGLEKIKNSDIELYKKMYKDQYGVEKV